MTSPRTARRVIEALSEQHPGADTELHYHDAFELLVATVLSAQSTDARVNLVTPALFAHYPTPAALAAAVPAELEREITSTGFFRQKAKALIGLSQMLLREHRGRVPADIEQLTRLPGVGRKTANVVLGHALGVPGLPVDRHVLRVATRIGIAEGDDPEAVEAQLCGALPRERWTLASDVLILHGRRVCRPRPQCDTCAVQGDCAFYAAEAGAAHAGPEVEAPRRTAATRRGRATTARVRLRPPGKRR
jgi:endonuclease-3